MSVSLAYAGFGVWSMVLGSYASFCVWVVSLWLICPWRPGRGRATVRLWRELAGFGLPLALGLLGDRARQGVQAVVTGSRARDGRGRAGALRRAHRAYACDGDGRDQLHLAVPSLLSHVPYRGATEGRLPTRTEHRHHRRGADIRHDAGGRGSIGRRPLGEQWRDAGVALAAMAGLGLGKAFQTVSEEAIKGAGRTKLLNWQTALELALSVVLLLVLIGPLGIAGVGLSVSLTALIVGGVMVALAMHVVRVPFRQILNATGPPILCALLGLATVAPLEHLVFHSDRTGDLGGIGLLIVDGLVFLLVYGASLVLVSPTTVRDVLRAVRLPRRRDRAGSGEPIAPDVGPSLDAATGEPSTPDETSGSGGSG